MNTKGGRDFGVTLKFLGANNGIVTGSATLVTIRQGNVIRSILVDYGSFQGIDEEYNDCREIDPSQIDAVVLTHPHLDHCGGLPKLFVDEGIIYEFKGKIYGSYESLREAIHILRDSAKVNDIKSHGTKGTLRRAKKSLKLQREKAIREDCSSKDIAQIDSDYSQISEQEATSPYGFEEVEEAIRRFIPINISSDDKFVDVKLFPGVVARFIPTSHINGSCMIELTASYGDQSYTVSFTGDIGKEETLLYKKMKFSVNPNVRSVVMESLHGTESSPERLCDSIDEFRRLLSRNLKRNRFITIPSFALDRDAGLVMLVNRFMDEGMHFRCVLDSPLALEELEEYMYTYMTGNSAWFKDLGKNPFSLERIEVPRNYEEHQYIVNSAGPIVCITSSGWGHGGRVLDYFEHHVQDDLSTFIFPGYMASYCPSRILHETQKGYMCELNGRRYIKHCDTYWLSGFSAHGYYEDKRKVLDAYPNIENIFLNHGDDDTIRDLYTEFNSKYPHVSVSVPSYEDQVILV